MITLFEEFGFVKADECRKKEPLLQKQFALGSFDLIAGRLAALEEGNTSSMSVTRVAHRVSPSKDQIWIAWLVAFNNKICIGLLRSQGLLWNKSCGSFHPESFYPCFVTQTRRQKLCTRQAINEVHMASRTLQLTCHILCL